MPFFSVIIPLYNKETFIENTLKSVLDQNFVDFEVLIINDGSTDDSEAKVLGFKDPRIQYFFKENGGVSSARNLGILKSQSDFITFIDADDYWYPDFLQEMFNNIQRFPDFSVFSGSIEIQTDKKIIPSSYSITKTADCDIVNFFEASLKECVIFTSCAVFHKEVFEKVGIFDDVQLKSSEDTDMWIRIGLVYPIVFSWKILARYVNDGKSLSTNYKKYIETSNFSKYELLERTNKDLKKFLDLNRFSLAIKSKIIGDKVRFNFYNKAIAIENMSLKKRILLQLPVYILRPLISLKTLLANLGLGNSVFK